MYSWKVPCVGIAEDSEFDDCRSIRTIGKEVANNLREKQVDMVSSQITSGNTAYHIEVDGERIQLQAASDGPRQYVRTMDEDSSTDPLLDLPTIEEYKHEERFGGV